MPTCPWVMMMAPAICSASDRARRSLPPGADAANLHSPAEVDGQVGQVARGSDSPWLVPGRLETDSAAETAAGGAEMTTGGGASNPTRKRG